MFCAPGFVFGCNEGVGYLFHVFRSLTHFRRYRGRQVPFSCFALPDTFSAVPRASGPVFMFCVPGLIFGGTRGVSSLFHVLHSRTYFRRYQRRQVPFSCFVRPDSFSAEPRPSGPVFMFCAPRLIFDGTEGVGSHFNVLRARTVFGGTEDVQSRFHVFGRTEGVMSLFHVVRSRTHFQRYRGRPIPFSCFPLPDMFWAVPMASSLFFMFCALGLVFGGIEGVRSLFHVFRSQTHFRRYRGRRVHFSCFALPNTFSAVPSSSGPAFLFCAPGLVFGDSRGVRSLFHVLHSRTHVRRYQGRRVPFSCNALPVSFPAVPRASGPVFKICAPILVFGGA
jgi:hypothetical protein